MILAFNISLVAYLLALLFAVIGLLSARRLFTAAVTGALSTGALSLIVYMGLRWVEAGRAPFSNMFESLVLFACTVIVVYLFVRFRLRVPALDAAASLLALLILAYASAFKSNIEPLMPALRSNWLTVHVSTCFLAYGGFAVSFLAAITYLIVSRKNSKAGPEVRNTLESVMAKTISFGFLFLAIGIITGSVWANYAWGTYWSWDPKETWSLITWLIYAIYLHCHFMRGWRGRRAAWIAVAGFISVVITYVGVNFLMKGLHSYALSAFLAAAVG